MEAKIAHANAYLFLFGGLAGRTDSGTCFTGGGAGAVWFSGVEPVIMIENGERERDREL